MGEIGLSGTRQANPSRNQNRDEKQVEGILREVLAVLAELAAFVPGGLDD